MPQKKKMEDEEKEENDEEKNVKAEEPEKEEKPKKDKKEEIGVKDKEVLLAPLEDYIKAAVHLGTRAVTPDMRQYVYRRKADGIAVLNTKKIDEKIAIAANFLAQYDPNDILVCCKREAGWKSIEAFKDALEGVRTFTRYPAGIITNPDLDDFFEPKVLLIIDPWLDKNALHDVTLANIPVVALCDTNNVTRDVDIVVPCNNKSAKSIGLVLYLIAKLYLEKRGIKKKLNPNDFYEIEEIAGKETGKKKIKEELLQRIHFGEEEKEKKEKNKEEKTRTTKETEAQP